MAIQLRLHYSQSPKHCKLQKPIPNHQSSFCWISLPLFTLSIIRSSCPPHSSLDITGIPLRWFESYLTGRSFRVAWDGGIQSTSIGYWGSPGIGSWTPPLLHIHYITGSHHTGTWLLLLCCADDTQLYLSFRPDDPTGSCTDLRLLTDISS